MKRPCKPLDISVQNISRRDFLQASAGWVGVSTFTAWLGTGGLARAVEMSSAAAQLALATSNLTPDQALAKLMKGNQRFVALKQSKPHQDLLRVKEVATGQTPFAAILSCADSRVVPEIAFDQGIGDLFVVRVAGNVAVMEDIASEEYAVGVLNTPLLMVLGHERCGAVDAALKGGELPGVMTSLVVAIQPALQASEGEVGDRLTNAVKANVRLQVKRLMTSAVISKAVQAGTLKVVGAFYDLDTGEVSLV